MKDITGTPHLRIPKTALALAESPLELGALLDLYNIADDRRYKAFRWPTRAAAKRWHLSTRAVIRLLADLQEEGLLQVTRPGGPTSARMIQVFRCGRAERMVERMVERMPERYSEGSSETFGVPETHTETHTETHSGTPVRAGTQPTPSSLQPTSNSSSSRGTGPLTLQQVLAMPVPADLEQVSGYCEAWRQFCHHRYALAPFSTEHSVRMIHDKQRSGLQKGYDPVEAFLIAEESGWKSVFPKPSRNQAPSGSGRMRTLGEKQAEEAWTRVEKAMQRFGGVPPGQPDGWTFHSEPAVDDRYRAAVAAAAQTDGLAAAWAVLVNGGRENDVKWQRIRFMNAFRRGGAK